MIIEHLPCPKHLRRSGDNVLAGADRVLYFLTGNDQSRDPCEDLADYIAEHADTPEIMPRPGERVQNLFSSLDIGPTLISDIPAVLDLMNSADRCHGGRTIMHNRRAHLVLSAAPNDRLDAAAWQAVIADTLRALDFDHPGHTWLAVRHGDTDIDHVHLYVSTIDAETGRAKKRHRDPGILRRLCMRLEDKFTLTRTGRDKEAARQEKQQQSAVLSEQVMQLIPAVVACKSWPELWRLMADHDLRIEHRPKAGLVISDSTGNEIRPGRISRSWSFSRLKERWGDMPAGFSGTPEVAGQGAQPKPPAHDRQTPQLAISAKYKNEAIRALLQRAVPGTLITGQSAAQARAAREAARLGIGGLAFDDEVIQAAYDYMIGNGTVLRTTEIRAFSLTPAPEQAHKQPDPAPPAELSVPAPEWQPEPFTAHFLRARGYTAGNDGEMRKGRHTLKVSEDGHRIGITDSRDMVAIRDALRALAASHPDGRIRISGSRRFQEASAAIAASLGISVVCADPGIRPVTPGKRASQHRRKRRLNARAPGDPIPSMPPEHPAAVHQPKPEEEYQYRMTTERVTAARLAAQRRAAEELVREHAGTAWSAEDRRQNEDQDQTRDRDHRRGRH